MSSARKHTTSRTHKPSERTARHTDATSTDQQPNATTNDANDIVHPGRLDDGYAMLALDYARAVTAALGGYQGVVLWAVIEGSWVVPWLDPKRPKAGRPEPLWVVLNCAHLERKTGLNRSRLAKARRQLVALGLLEERADGAIRPGKNFRKSWLGGFTDKGRLLTYAAEGADTKTDIQHGDVDLSARPADAPGRRQVAQKRHILDGADVAQKRHMDAVECGAKAPPNVAQKRHADMALLRHISDPPSYCSKNLNSKGKDKEEKHPPTPQGGAVCVGVGSDSFPLEDPEPQEKIPPPAVHASMQVVPPLESPTRPVDASPGPKVQPIGRELTGRATDVPLGGDVVNDPADIERAQWLVCQWFDHTGLGMEYARFIHDYRHAYEVGHMLRLFKRARIKNQRPKPALMLTILATWAYDGPDANGVELFWTDDPVPKPIRRPQASFDPTAYRPAPPAVDPDAPPANAPYIVKTPEERAESRKRAEQRTNAARDAYAAKRPVAPPPAPPPLDDDGTSDAAGHGRAQAMLAQRRAQRRPQAGEGRAV